MQVTATMKAWILCGITTAALGAHQGAIAVDMDDCVLNGLKGVNSDAAVRMVRQSCENKVANQKWQQTTEKYGEKIDEKMLYVRWDSDNANKLVKVTLKNELLQTVTYVELSISQPQAKGQCPYPDSRKHLYAVKVKPGSSVVLIVPDGPSLVSNDGRICISSRAVRGRAPGVLDVSIGAVSPLSDKQVAALNQDLSEQYAIIDPPVYSTPGRGIDFKITVEDLLKMACENEVKKKYPPTPHQYLEVYECMTRSIR